MKRANGKKEIIIVTKFGKFLGVFEPNTPDPGFTVTSPAAPGFVTYGRTFGEAKQSARTGLEFHCESILLEGIGQTRRAPQRLAR